MPIKTNKADLSADRVKEVNKLIQASLLLTALLVFFSFLAGCNQDEKTANPATNDNTAKDTTVYWMAPDINGIRDSVQKEMVSYGRELISHTSKYLGPRGIALHMSNGMNCQNCHLVSGTAVYGINFGSVASQYPKFRARSGSIESIVKRINDCFERSLNGKSLDSSGREMQAILAYLHFIGSNVDRGKKAAGSGLKDLAFPAKAADPEKGRAVYIAKCQLCHQADGQGLFNPDHTENIYPALWGDNSYNDAAGLYRISSFAAFVKNNMPQGTTYRNPRLTDEEAWDVAAFVNSRPRPHLAVPRDWPDISKKPVDLPFGPYADSFSEKQHKFGPFKPIAGEQKSR